MMTSEKIDFLYSLSKQVRSINKDFLENVDTKSDIVVRDITEDGEVFQVTDVCKGQSLDIVLRDIANVIAHYDILISDNATFSDDAIAVKFQESLQMLDNAYDDFCSSADKRTSWKPLFDAVVEYQKHEKELMSHYRIKYPEQAGNFDKNLSDVRDVCLSAINTLLKDDKVNSQIDLVNYVNLHFLKELTKGLGANGVSLNEYRAHLNKEMDTYDTNTNMGLSHHEFIREEVEQLDEKKHPFVHLLKTLLKAVEECQQKIDENSKDTAQDLREQLQHLRGTDGLGIEESTSPRNSSKP